MKLNFNFAQTVELYSKSISEDTEGNPIFDWVKERETKAFFVERGLQAIILREGIRDLRSKTVQHPFFIFSSGENITRDMRIKYQDTFYAIVFIRVVEWGNFRYKKVEVDRVVDG